MADSDMTARTALLVVGMHRSGTSAVAGCLARAGVPLGSELLAAGEDNPKGYFEHAEAVRIDDGLLDALGRRWDDVRPMPGGWIQAPAAREARRAISAWIDGEFAGEAVFAIKDPRMCRLLPVWLEALRAVDVEPRILMVVRHPAEVAASIRKRNGWEPVVSEVLWLEHVLAAERDSRDCPRAVMTYDSLLSSPERHLSQAVSALGLKGIGERIHRVGLEGFVTSADRHFTGATGEGSGGSTEHLADEAWTLVSQGALEPTRFDSIDERLRGVLQAPAGWVDALSEMALAYRREADVVKVELANQQSALRAQVAWSDSAVERREALQAELAQARSSLAAQEDWSRAAVQEREALQAELAQTRSSLAAQEDWSRAAVQEREVLQAELAQTRSSLAAQEDWSSAAVQEREALQAELARMRSDFAAQLAWSEQAVRKQEDLYEQLTDAHSRATSLKTALDDAAARLVDAENALRDAVVERDHLKSALSRYEATLLGRLQHRLMTWNDARRAGVRKETR